MNDKKILTVLISIALIFSFSIQEAEAQSQGSIQFETVEVNLFPELFQPAVYVAFDIRLVDDISLPKTLTLQIPAKIEDFAVSYLDEDGYYVSPDVTVSRDFYWKYLQFSSPSPTIKLEYNDPDLALSGFKMSYTFNWSSLYPAFRFVLNVYQPEGISDFTADRTLEVTNIENSNIMISSLKQSPLPSEELLQLSFSYVKTGEINYTNFKVEAGDPITENTAGRVPPPGNLVIWLLSVALTIVILVGLYFIWFRRRTTKQRGQMVQGVGIMNPEKMAVFCHECGMRSSPGDSFCSNCGTELRKLTAFIRSNR